MEEEEYQRFMGFPVSLWSHRAKESSVSSLRHPIAWFRWRIAVRSKGPYAPDFEQFRRGAGSETE